MWFAFYYVYDCFINNSTDYNCIDRINSIIVLSYLAPKKIGEGGNAIKSCNSSKFWKENQWNGEVHKMKA